LHFKRGLILAAFSVALSISLKTICLGLGSDRQRLDRNHFAFFQARNSGGLAVKRIGHVHQAHLCADIFWK
jgi:hypothetical protein